MSAPRATFRGMVGGGIGACILHDLAGVFPGACCGARGWWAVRTL